MEPDAPIRVAAVRMDPSDWRRGFSKTSGIYPALDARVRLVGVVNPPIRQLDRLTRVVATRAAVVAPVLGGVRAAVRSLEWRARRAEELIARLEPYDVLFADETQAFVPPGRVDRPYVIYTDNTYALTDRWFPNWLPYGRAERRRLMAYERETYRRATRVFCMSEFVARSVTGDYGCDDAVVDVVGAGTRPVALEDDVRETAPTALFVGIDFQIKGGPTLLEAWRDVAERLPRARLWIVGPEPRASDPSIVWFGRIASRDALERLYRRAHVFVLPSRFEAFGIAFLEAMMHGLPAIGTNRCAMPELIADGATGCLVPVDDAAALADALVGLLGDLTRAQRLGAAARASVATTMTWDAVAERIVARLPR